MSFINVITNNFRFGRCDEYYLIMHVINIFSLLTVIDFSLLSFKIIQRSQIYGFTFKKYLLRDSPDEWF